MYIAKLRFRARREEERREERALHTKDLLIALSYPKIYNLRRGRNICNVSKNRLILEE
jgi:hypothetical protein